MSRRLSLPSAAEPPTRRRRARAPRSIVAKGRGVAGSPGAGRTPAQAPPPRPDGPAGRQDAGAGGKPGRGPPETARSFGQPGGRRQGPAAASTPRHLSQRGWQRSPKADPHGRARAPNFRALSFGAKTSKAPGGRGTQGAHTALPVRRRTAATRCRRRCGPRAPSARAPPSVPWSPGGDASGEGWAAGLPARACGACACGAGRRGPARPRSGSAAAEPGGFEWERVRRGGGVICECAAYLGSGWLALQPPPPQHTLRLLLLPSCVGPGEAGSADARPRSAWRAAGLPADRSSFFLKGESGATHLARVWNAILPALSEGRMTRKSASRTRALSPERVPRASPCVLFPEPGAPGAERGPPGAGAELSARAEGR